MQSVPELPATQIFSPHCISCFDWLGVFPGTFVNFAVAAAQRRSAVGHSRATLSMGMRRALQGQAVAAAAATTRASGLCSAL